MSHAQLSEGGGASAIASWAIQHAFARQVVYLLGLWSRISEVVLFGYGWIRDSLAVCIYHYMGGPDKESNQSGTIVLHHA